MNRQPEYFESVREKASRMWNQLEDDPHLAGPWHQLFRQVQSPRHVLSELLQNADDAGATEASVSLQGDEFVFTHNGEDFEPDHFASLCRFGYSNKRALHTIGFRGVGFKSTFSLGNEVRLLTPSLSVAFQKHRFTEPVWIEGHKPDSDRTEVRVTIEDIHRKLELQKNLQEWFKSPASLLFFRGIRSLRIEDVEVRWEPRGAGPVRDSVWMGLTSHPDASYLLIRSAGEEFPKDALQEIRSERMLSVDENFAFPPCRVEIVLGLEGRLFVILPTGVKTKLPFACNAPFVQDPARLKIKDPETSPTNRWLFERLGKLAAVAMRGWLERKDFSREVRSQAYNLFPDVDRDDNSLEGSCATIVETAFDNAVEGQRFLLAEEGHLTKWGECIAVPNTVLDVWSTDQVKEFFIDAEHSILCRQISEGNRRKLIHWTCVEEREKANILDALVSKRLPKPDSWMKLLLLWEYVSSEVNGYYYRQRRKDFRILPVRGKEVLYSAKEVVRLGEDRLLNSQDDWEFLARFLLVIDQNWVRFLTSQRREAEGSPDAEKQVAAADAVISSLGHAQPSEMTSVIQQVSKKFFAVEDPPAQDCVRLAQVAATLGAIVPDDFQYFTLSGLRMKVSQQVVVDLRNDLDVLIEPDWYKRHVLSDEYTSHFQSCTRDDWELWISSGRSGLLTFIPLTQKEHDLWNRPKLLATLKERGFSGDVYYPYKTNTFVVEDWDFDSNHWGHWREHAEIDSSIWSRVLQRVVKQPKEVWTKTLSARALQIASTGTRKAVTQETLLPSWIIKLRALPCLPDTRGNYHQPAELLRRTPDTESLLEVEPFVRADLDNETTRALLIQLGVRDTPTGPGRLLERLETLARIDNPPIYEIEKWYYRLDQMVTKCSTGELQEIRTAFETKKIILTESKEWGRATEVFIARDDEDVPGASVIFPSVSHLSLWSRVGVEDRPTIELAIEWLKSLPSGQALSQDELRRVRSLLHRHPERIWDECGHWLNLEGQWSPISNFAYSLTMQSLVAWKHLFTDVKQRTADLQKLSTETCQHHPFSDLPTLASSIEEHFKKTLFGLPAPKRKPWLETLGSGLRRVVLENEAETDRVRALAERLAETRWQVAIGLETIPYIGGTPVGTARRIDVIWKDSLLYVEDRSTAKMAKNVAHELGRVFERIEIADSIKLCYDRSPEFVIEYLEENFKLAEVVQEQESEAVDDVASSDVSQGSADNDATTFDQTLSLETNEPEGLEQGLDVAVALPEEGIVEAGAQPESVLDLEDESESVRKSQPKPPKPSLIERFTRARGFNSDGDDRYYHSDGRSIIKATGMRFPWEMFSVSGQLLQCYWIKDHCIQEDPLQLPAEIWSLCDQSPRKYSLVLSDADDKPVEISGKRLKEMCDSGELTLHPATYRLVYEAA